MTLNDYPFGTDISYWNGAIDYDRLKSVSEYVAVRAGISWYYEDPIFAQAWQELAGTNRIAYHVVYPSQDAIRQADWCLDIINRAGGADWDYDRLALDLELDQGCTTAQITDTVLEMMEYLNEITGQYPILYSRAGWVNSFMHMTDPRLINADWWLAYYRTRRDPDYTPEMPPPPLLPRSVDKWLIHQTSERGIGREHGVSSNYIDTNRWNEEYKKLDEYFGRGKDNEHKLFYPIIIRPEYDPIYSVKITAKSGLLVRNGPGTQYEQLGTFPYNRVLDVYEIKKGWYRVHPDKNWWCYSRYLRKLARKNRKPSDLREII